MIQSIKNDLEILEIQKSLASLNTDVYNVGSFNSNGFINGIGGNNILATQNLEYLLNLTLSNNLNDVNNSGVGLCQDLELLKNQVLLNGYCANYNKKIEINEEKNEKEIMIQGKERLNNSNEIISTAPTKSVESVKKNHKKVKVKKQKASKEAKI